jgi:hypothetical protein
MTRSGSECVLQLLSVTDGLLSLCYCRCSVVEFTIKEETESVSVSSGSRGGSVRLCPTITFIHLHNIRNVLPLDALKGEPFCTFEIIFYQT